MRTFVQSDFTITAIRRELIQSELK